jgi:hypothetical protein
LVVTTTSPEVLKQAFDAISSTGTIEAGKEIVGLSRWMALAHFKPEIAEQARSLVRSRRVCRNGHLIAGDNIKIQNRNGLGIMTRLCRKCYLARRKRSDQGGVIGELRLRRIITAVDDHGASIANLTDTRAARAIGIKKIVSRPRLMAFASNSDPRLARLGRLILKRAQDNADRQRNDRRVLLRVAASPFVLRNDGAEAHEAIKRATAHIWEGDRGDVQGLMWLAALQGLLTRRDCTPAKANEYLRIHNHRPRTLGDARYSLDATIGEDGTATWLDTKTDEDHRLWA